MDWVTISLFREDIHFSAGHFTILGPTQRERLHGHNYGVKVAARLSIDEETGLTVDYRVLRQTIKQLCNELNEIFLVPAHSKFLKIEDRQTNWEIGFDQDCFSLPKGDVLMLPVKNITTEELSRYLSARFVERVSDTVNMNMVAGFDVSVCSGNGQQTTYQWENKS